MEIELQLVHAPACRTPPANARQWIVVDRSLSAVTCQLFSATQVRKQLTPLPIRSLGGSGPPPLA